MQKINRVEWFPQFIKKSNCRLRLFCFPFAGGAASAFRDWAEQVPDHVDLRVAELPGRGVRFSEPLIHDMTELVEQMADDFLSYQDIPFLFFGHSIGSLVSFNLARVLRKRGMLMPEAMLVSGKKPPHFPAAQNLHRLPDDSLTEALKNYDGTPEVVLGNPELMSILLPILRADFSLDENYQYLPEPGFDFPIYAFGGTDDSGVPPNALAEWQAHTVSRFDAKLFPGGHFYLHDDESKAKLLTEIKLILTAIEAEQKSALS